MSGVGKGVATASIGKIFQQYGFSVTAVKIDPYINVDAGTMRPTEHGEVWVTDDGGEIDQDLGNYERFLDYDIPKRNNITTGQVYQALIERERKGEFLGQTVQFIPHVPEEIKRRILSASKGFDICLVEIGGTVGDYENIPFLFALKSLEREIGKDNIIYGLVSYLPVPEKVGEMKTKPTQTAIHLLTENGIFPDFILCRAHERLDSVRKKKIEMYANIEAEYIISAPDVNSTIYKIPLNFENEFLGRKLCHKLRLVPRKEPDWSEWSRLVGNLEVPREEITIAIVGKYLDIGNFSLEDSYISVREALMHAGAQLNCGVRIKWVDSKSLEDGDMSALEDVRGVLVPGGFGGSGVEGKIAAIKHARENGIPFLGLCYGLQLAIVEFARNVCRIKGAHTTEVKQNASHPVIDLLPEQASVSEKGGTMRLGAYAAVLKEGTAVYDLYYSTGRLEHDAVRVDALRGDAENSFRLGEGSGSVALEVHRHRFEMNPAYVEKIEEGGLVFSGYHERSDGTKLMEFIELPGHPFFCATQAHPEFHSRLGKPAPLFYGFIRAALNLKEKEIEATSD